MTTPPTDPKALAEEALERVNIWGFERGEDVVNLLIHPLARAVLALDEENEANKRVIRQQEIDRQKVIVEATRNVERVDAENQRLRTALENYVAYDHEWFNLSLDNLKQAREALERKP